MMTAENSTGSSDDSVAGPGSWFGSILVRATELLVAEDERLAGIAFSVVQADEELGIILAVRGDPSTHTYLPEAPVVFKKFIREAALEIGPNPDLEIVLRDDPHWPLLAYQGHLDAMDDPEGAKVLELPSSRPPAVETRVDTAEGEAVDHPAHYNAGSIEVIDAIEDWGFGEGFNRGNAIKYIARAGKKPGADELEDLEKAAWYLGRELERVRKLRG